MKDYDSLFAALNTSAFRRRIRLEPKERAYLPAKSMEVVLRHAADYVEKRLAPAHPPNDGMQTPWRGHPVFVAQHATATCCRGCVEKWHAIPKGRTLSESEKEYVVEVIRCWLAVFALPK